MIRLRYLALAALALIAWPVGATGQVTDSVTIEVLEPPTSIIITAPERAYRGDEITVAYQIVGEGGQPTVGMATWDVRPEGRATILSQTDSTVTIRLDQPGVLWLTVDVARAVQLVQGFEFLQPMIDESGEDPVRLEAGRFLWAGGGQERVGQLDPGQLVHVCAVAVTGDGRVVVASSRSCHANLASLVGFVPPLNDQDAPNGSFATPPVYLDTEGMSFPLGELGEWYDEERSIVRAVSRGAER